MVLGSVLFPFVLQNTKLKDMPFLRAARALRAVFASKQILNVVQFTALK